MAAEGQKTGMLDTPEGRRAFERGLVQLIEQGYVDRARYLTQKACKEYGSPALVMASGVDPVDVTISGWEHIERHLAGVRATGKEPAVRLGVVNRVAVNGQGKEPVSLTVSFHEAMAAEGRFSGTVIPISPDIQPLPVMGLDGLVLFQRRTRFRDYCDGPADGHWETDALLAGFMLTIITIQVIERMRTASTALHDADIWVETDTVDRPMEVGLLDLGPEVRRLLPRVEQGGSTPSARAELEEERLREGRTAHQGQVAKTFAGYRELYRIVRMFPFYRMSARNKVGDVLTSQLRSWCRAKDIPEKGVSWRMDKRAFEALLVRIAHASVHDPAAVLGVEHVNDLHDQWLRIAKEKDFVLGSGHLSLFEMQLAYALKFGGPWVEYRWEEAKPYVID